MDAKRFDEITRNLAISTSRRRFLAGTGLGIAATVASGAVTSVSAQGPRGTCEPVGERPIEVCAVLGTQCTVGATNGICCTHIHKCPGLLNWALRKLGIVISNCSACVCETGVNRCPGE